MSPALTHQHSPLAQIQGSRRVALANSSRQLSPADQARFKQILTQKYDYVTNAVFWRRDAYRKLFEQQPEIKHPDTSWYQPIFDSDPDTNSVKRRSMTLLTASEERTLFLQFNYCRYKVFKLRDQVRCEAVDGELALEILDWDRRADGYRGQIAHTNLALVLAMVKRTRMNAIDFSDLVSEGNMALLRAVDKFDASRGFKFSTYACRAILKAFSRTGVKLSRYRQLFPTDFDPQLERSDYLKRKREDVELDCVDELRRIVGDNRAHLSSTEQSVIEHRFALGPDGRRKVDSRPMTLEQVGKVIGVTKERVRQIQNQALEKIRLSLEAEYLA